MKNLLIAFLLAFRMGHAMEIDQGLMHQKNGIEHWEDEIISIYKEEATGREAYFVKKHQNYHACVYKTDDTDFSWRNPSSLDDPEAVFEELKAKFWN